MTPGFSITHAPLRIPPFHLAAVAKRRPQPLPSAPRILKQRPPIMASFYELEKNCDWYESIAKDYDSTPMIQRFKSHVQDGSKVLELGIGPGIDHDALRESFAVVGSDYSDIFVNRYLAKHPDADVRKLDAVTIDPDVVKDVVPFDAIFTNKVLQHLTKAQFQQSLSRQAAVIRTGGIIFHTLWCGEEEMFHEGLRFQNYTEESLRALLPENLEFVTSEQYKEMKENDSIVVVLRRIEEEGNPATSS